MFDTREIDVDLLRSSPICRDHLMRSLGYVDSKLHPDETCFDVHVDIKTLHCEVIGQVNVFIRTAHARRQRIYLQCPICELWIPLAAFRRHFGSKTCDHMFWESVELRCLEQSEIIGEMNDHILNITRY